MNLPSDLKHYRAPLSFEPVDSVIAFLALVAIALILLAFWGAYG